MYIDQSQSTTATSLVYAAIMVMGLRQNTVQEIGYETFAANTIN